MAFKHHAEHRHHIPKPRYRVTNWAEYDASLKRRGSLTVWFTEQAIQAWRAEPRTTPGGQSHYSALAITTALTMRMVFGLALRQTEGLIGSVTGLLGLDLAVPDHSTLSRRGKTLQLPPLRRTGSGPLHLLVDSTGLKLGGAGEWLVEKHGTSRRRSWRKRRWCTNVTGVVIWANGEVGGQPVGFVGFPNRGYGNRCLTNSTKTAATRSRRSDTA